MADAPNIYVSNGTCYTGQDKAADTAMIPCGNVYFQPQACCQHEDYCLQSSVCYNAAHGVTYVAGCTDKEYKASVCPDKFDDADAPWLGMSYCNDTSDDWVLCDQKGHPATLESPDPCACPTATAERSMTLNQAQGIAETASLPAATGLPINWNTDFFPTIPSVLPSSSTTAHSTRASTTAASHSNTSPTSSISSTTSTAAITATTADPSSPPFPTSFTTSARIGTAIGASVFGILLLALLGFFILRRRRRQQPAELNDASNDGGGGNKTPGPPPPPDSAPPDRRIISVAYGSGTHDVSQLSHAPPPASEPDNKSARPWSMVSELDGSDNGGGGGGGGGGGYGAGAGPMAAIMEASQGRGVGCHGHATCYGGEQGEAGPSELEAPRRAWELPA